MIEIGSAVHWTAVATGRGVLSMQKKQGTVTAIEGKWAKVKTRRGRVVTVAIGRLRLAGQTSQITEFVEAVCGREE